ncbi:MAG: DUF808 family protein [Methylophilaceae bacterium]|nr:DUF808 family protein [Methylophilaceae bacterium]
MRTDFILPTEIIVLYLNTVKDFRFQMQVIVVTLITFGVTVFVYGLVAGIVKLNGLGLHLMLKKDKVFGGSDSVNSVKKY